MAVQKIDDEYYINNPAVSGLPGGGSAAAQTTKLNVGSQGKYVNLGDETMSSLGLRVGNKVYSVSPRDIVGEQKQGELSGQWYNRAYGEALRQLGINATDVSKVNTADFQPAGITMESADLNKLKSLYGTNVSTPDYGPTMAQAQAMGNNAPLTQEQYNQKAQTWVDPATGQTSAAGVGMPQSTAQTGTHILNEQDLQAKRKELAGAGIPQSEWSKYISSPDASGKLYYSKPATLTSPTGQKKVVASGSAEANQLFAAGWTLGGPAVNEGSITAGLLTPEANINIGSGISTNNYTSNAATAGAKATSAATDAIIKQYQEMLTPPETALSQQVADLLGDVGEGAESLTGRGAAQLAEEEKRDIQEKSQALASKNTLLKQKLAEIDTLTASYNQANQEEEGRPMTLSRLQGAQARNYKMYMAQKNMLTAEAGYLQAELQGLQGELEAAQASADRAVELEYADRESAYNAKLAQLQILQPQLEKEEARYASALQMVLQQQADALAEEKANKKDIIDVKLKAISAGITNPSVLSRIGSAKTYEEALQIMGTNMPVKKTGSAGPSKEENEIQAFRDDAAKLIGELDKTEDGIAWATAFDQLRLKYPQASNEAINNVLGGGIPYNPATGEWDTAAAFGRAK